MQRLALKSTAVGNHYLSEQPFRHGSLKFTQMFRLQKCYGLRRVSSERPLGIKTVDVVERLFLLKETEHLGVRSRLILLVDLMTVYQGSKHSRVYPRCSFKQFV